MPEETEFINRLLDQWQAGIDCEENFRQLFEKYYHRLFRFFEKRGFSVEESDDLTQETFFRIYTGLTTFRREAKFETWMFQIATNTYRQWRRRQLAHQRDGRPVSWESMAEQGRADLAEGQLDGSVIIPGPLDEVLADERQRVLQAAIEALPAQMRQCMSLRIYQELSYQEIAVAMQLSVETVKSHLHQGRQQLRKKLAEYYHER
jgi:RNA polymerase sigma-70 factor (ECF subfamily)